MRFKTKHLVEWGPPFHRKFSDLCSVWHIPCHVKQNKESNTFQCCKACKKLQHDIDCLVKRANTTAESQKVARTLPSSKYPVSKLSPDSLRMRVKKASVERQNLISKINRLNRFDCDVSDKQHAELLKLVKSVNDKGSRVIQELINEGEHQLGENNLLKESWKQDVVERLSFEEDQRRSG